MAEVRYRVAATEGGTALLSGSVGVTGGSWSQALTIPAGIADGATWWLGRSGLDDAGNAETWKWTQFVLAAAAQVGDWPQALGPMTALPSWTDSTEVATSGVRATPGDIPEWTATRTYELPNLPASGRDITSAWNACFGANGTVQDGDVVTIPAGTWYRANLDMRANKRYRVVGGNAALSAPARLLSTSPTQHAVRVLGGTAARVMLKGASKTARLELVVDNVAGRGDQNQQGMTCLLLDSSDQTGNTTATGWSACTGFRGQDLLLEAPRAAGQFNYNHATDFWFNRVEVKGSLADAFHTTGGCSYGVWTDCISDGHGDDGLAFVHYAGRDSLPRQSHHMQVYRHLIKPNAHGRGLANISCADIVADQVRVIGTASAGVIIDSAESYGSTYDKPAISGVHYRRVEVLACNWGSDDHGSVLLRAGASPALIGGTLLESFKIVDAKGNRQGIRAFGGSAPVATLSDFVFTGGKSSTPTLGPVNQANGADSITKLRWDETGASTTATPTVPPVVTFEVPSRAAVLTGTLSGFPGINSTTPVTTTEADWRPRNTGFQTNAQVFQGKAGATRGLTKVDVYLGNDLVHTQSTFDGDGSWKTGPINTTTRADGAYEVRAVATGTGGLTSTSTRQVTVLNTVPVTPVPTATGGRPGTSQTLLLDVDAAGSGTVGQSAPGMYATSGAPARSFVQSSTADQPVVAAGPQSGQKAVQFDGGYLRLPSSGITGVQRATWSFVMRVDGPGSNNRPAVLSAAANATDDYSATSGAWNWTAPRLATATSWDSSTIGGSVVSSNDSTVSISPTVAFGKWVLVEVEVGTDGSNARMWVDGVQVADLAGRTDANGLALGNLVLGSRTYANGYQDRSRVTITRLLAHQGARPTETLAWARSTYGVAAPNPGDGGTGDGSAVTRTSMVYGSDKPVVGTLTGVPAGTSLTDSEDTTTPLVISTAGTYRRQRYRRRVQVTVRGVRFEECEFVGPATAHTSDHGLLQVTSDAFVGATEAEDVQVVDCTFRPRALGNRVNGFLGWHTRFERCDFSRVVDPFGVHGYNWWNANGQPSSYPSGFSAKGCTWHDLYFDAASYQSDGYTHNDGVQVQGGDNGVILGCWGVARRDTTVGEQGDVGQYVGGRVLSNVLVQDNVGLPSGWVIDRNWFDAGHLSVNISSAITSLRVTGNRFDGTASGRDINTDQTAAARTGVVISGNTRTDGTTVNLRRGSTTTQDAPTTSSSQTTSADMTTGA